MRGTMEKLWNEWSTSDHEVL